MTSRVIPHLKNRLREIEATISRLKFQIEMLKETRQTKEETLFAYKVERQALKRAFKSWNNPEEETDNDPVED